MSTYSVHDGLSRAELVGHRARLASIRPRVDQSTPSSYYVLLSRAKKEQQQQDWAVNVDAANLALLQRMIGIHSSKPWDEHSRIAQDRERRKREQSEQDRYRLQQRIDEENGALLRRLQTARSQYGAGNWQSHAAAYEQHIRQVRLRQMLLHDPLHAKQRIREEKEKERERQRRLRQRKQQKLSPLQPQGADTAYERDDSIDRQEAEEAAQRLEEESSRELQVAAFEVSVSELTDPASVQQQQAGSLPGHRLSFVQFFEALEEDSSALLLHHQRHSVDGRRCMISLHELNRGTAKGDDSAAEWKPFTTAPPLSLHSFLVRCVELDTERHTHLYLPFAPMTQLGEGEERLQRMIGMLGFGQDGGLIFKQQLMPAATTETKRPKTGTAAAGKLARKSGKAERPTPAAAVKPAKKDKPSKSFLSRIIAAVSGEPKREAGAEEKQAAFDRKLASDAKEETEEQPVPAVAASPAQPESARQDDVPTAAAAAAAPSEEKEAQEEDYADDAETESPAQAEAEQPQQAQNSSRRAQPEPQEASVPAAADKVDKAGSGAPRPADSTKTTSEEKTAEVQSTASAVTARSSVSAAAASTTPRLAVVPPIAAPLSARSKSPHSHNSHRTIREQSQ